METAPYSMCLIAYHFLNAKWVETLSGEG